MPVIGVPFRRTREEMNEIELLVMVTPEFVSGMSPCETPCGGPGYATTNPNNCQLYCAGHVEVPAQCNPIAGPYACGDCCQNGCQSGCGCGPQGSAESVISDGVSMQGGTGYDDANGPTPVPSNMPSQMPSGDSVEPDSMTLPPPHEAAPLPPQASRKSGTPDKPAAARTAGTEYTVPRPYSPSRAPVFVRNAASPDNPTVVTDDAASAPAAGGLIGPVGYDAE
jgi:hypothetical protein